MYLKCKAKKTTRHKFSDSEYTSLRNEIVQRIAVISNQSYSAIFTLISTWGAGLALFKCTIDYAGSGSIIRGICSFLFIIPVFYFVPLSVKSGENVVQIASIAAYIKVFYEYLSLSESNELFNWETSNRLISNVSPFKGKRKYQMIFYNEEYTILSVFSIVIYICLAYYSLQQSIQNKSFGSEEIVLVIVYSIILITAILLCVFIHNSSSLKKTMMVSENLYVELYVKRAIEMGLISEENFVDVMRELNPAREI
ncbi:MAG: hypothetical protein Q4F95_04340 [Oscillospiraceae bacterium]|nr:hypothetical protein [Oscillospiraceae bacterium]